MTTPVLLINQDDTKQRRTKILTESECKTHISCLGGGCQLAVLPVDEALNESDCYIIYIKLAGSTERTFDNSTADSGVFG
jgi:hypothetical protein